MFSKFVVTLQIVLLIRIVQECECHHNVNILPFANVCTQRPKQPCQKTIIPTTAALQNNRNINRRYSPKAVAMIHPATTTPTRNTSSSSSSRRRRRRRSRSACRFFVWDAISAFRFHLCNRLLRDCVYEGLGGKKFVRIKPGSLLESLYPPSQHGPDKCLLCGMSFRDHLTCWWYPQLYSCYDTHLNEMRRNGTMSLAEYDDYMMYGNLKSIRTQQKKKKKNFMRNNNNYNIHNRKRRKYHRNSWDEDEYESGLSPLYQQHPYNQQRNGNQYSKSMYHQQFVKDISNVSNIKSNKRRKVTKPSQLKALNHKQNENVVGPANIQRRRMAGVTFIIPKMKNAQQRGRGSIDTTILVVARNLVLAKLEELLWIEKLEGVFIN